MSLDTWRCFKDVFNKRTPNSDTPYGIVLLLTSEEFDCAIYFQSEKFIFCFIKEEWVGYTSWFFCKNNGALEHCEWRFYADRSLLNNCLQQPRLTLWKQTSVYWMSKGVRDKLMLLNGAWGRDAKRWNNAQHRWFRKHVWFKVQFIFY